MMKFIALALATGSASAASVTIAGYVSASDVTAHSQIDLDFKEMDTCLGSYQFACAWNRYANGGNSVKSSGAIRTLRGFATSELDDETIGAVYYSYWGTNSYADNFITSSVNGTYVGDSTNNFASASNTARDQLAGKGTAYQAVWRYVFHELEAAVEKCEDGNLDDDSGAPHAWDEGWAFYAGSLEGSAVGGSSSGVLVYRLAEKRCGNFGTCANGLTGTSKVNTKLLSLYQKGLTYSQAGSCDDIQDTQMSILSYQLIPLMQGTLRYAYKCDPAAGNEGDKACAEGWAFASAVLPALDVCDSKAALVVKNNLNLQLSAAVPDGFAAVKEAVESTYSCLEISCDDVGGLYKDSSTYYTGMEPCTDSLSPASHATPMAFVLGLAVFVGLAGLA